MSEPTTPEPEATAPDEKVAAEAAPPRPSDPPPPVEAAPSKPAGPLPWDIVLARSTSLLVGVTIACVFAAAGVWGLAHLGALRTLVLQADDIRVTHETAATRASLFHWALAGLLPAAAFAVHAIRKRRRGVVASAPWAPLLGSFVGLPLLVAPHFEYEHVFLTGTAILTIGAAAGYLAHALVRARRRPLPDLTDRHAWILVLAGWAIFAAWMGFLSHWRFITFHAEPYDMSWEVNAVHGIVHTGIPRVSVAAGNYYNGMLLPANYADAHTPWIYYFYAPFYAVLPDGRTLLWLQAIHMGAGAVGVYLFARRWLATRWLAVIAAIAYLADPNLQAHCLHDLHANYLAIPTMLLALGLMEAKRPGWAFFCVLVTAITREETGVYAAAVGLYWALGGGSRARVRWGMGATVASIAILLLITKVVMPAAGGQPRYSHFGMFFDPQPGIGSTLKVYLLNPFGALDVALSPMRSEYLFYSLVPFGLLFLRGWRAWPFLLIPLGLLIPATNGSFFVPGMNYSAPIIPVAVILSILGLRALLARRGASRSPRRAGFGAYLLVTALLSDYVYGNILAKSYKLEYGQLPFRRENDGDYMGAMGYVRSLPAYGPRERALWDIVAHVPTDGPIATSWYLNPQLSNRSVSLLYPIDGAGHPKENLARYIVLDRLYPSYRTTENDERLLRANPAFEVLYENRWGIIFRRK